MNNMVMAALIGFIASGGAAALPSLLYSFFEWCARDRRPLRADGYTQDGCPTLVSLAMRKDPRIAKVTPVADESAELLGEMGNPNG